MVEFIKTRDQHPFKFNFGDFSAPYSSQPFLLGKIDFPKTFFWGNG